MKKINRKKKIIGVKIKKKVGSKKKAEKKINDWMLYLGGSRNEIIKIIERTGIMSDEIMTILKNGEEQIRTILDVKNKNYEASKTNKRKNDTEKMKWIKILLRINRYRCISPTKMTEIEAIFKHKPKTITNIEWIKKIDPILKITASYTETTKLKIWEKGIEQHIIYNQYIMQKINELPIDIAKWYIVEGKEKIDTYIQTDNTKENELETPNKKEQENIMIIIQNKTFREEIQKIEDAYEIEEFRKEKYLIVEKKGKTLIAKPNGNEHIKTKEWISIIIKLYTLSEKEEHEYTKVKLEKGILTAETTKERIIKALEINKQKKRKNSNTETKEEEAKKRRTYEKNQLREGQKESEEEERESIKEEKDQTKNFIINWNSDLPILKIDEICWLSNT